MNGHLSKNSVWLCEKTLNRFERLQPTDKKMDILARRLTIISLLMVVFAMSLAAAVGADTERRRQNTYIGSLTDCTAHTAQYCQAKL